MRKKTRCALLIVSPEFLRAALQIDEKAIITGIHQPHDRNGNITIRVHGVGPETKEGGLITAFDGTVTTLDDGSKVIDWGLT